MLHTDELEYSSISSKYSIHLLTLTVNYPWDVTHLSTRGETRVYLGCNQNDTLDLLHILLKSEVENP